MSSHYIPNTRIPTLVFPSSAQASRHAALTIAKVIRDNNAAGKPAVLGLATGSTPMGVYRELIRMHREEGLDFSRVITFNLDEYYPMAPTSPHSYHQFMDEQLFNHINIPRENIHIPTGTVDPDEIDDWCAEYEQLIRKTGGIDLQILGIGRSGHIGFNEPGSTRTSRTRLITLDPITRRDAADDFFGERNVPTRAVTMGVGTILEARKILLLAFGEHKAPVVRRMVEEEPSETVTASFLQDHKDRDATVLLDLPAASELTVYRRPWEAGPVKWTPELVRHAVITLALGVGKPLLKLSDEDFREHHLYDLLNEHGPAEALGERIFRDRFETIRTHPLRHDRQTVLLFSPHPDDDVISMGGTMIRLAEQGHEVHVAYMTSGNVAVFDHDAQRFVDFVEAFNRYFKIAPKQTSAVREEIESFLQGKESGQPDIEALREVKKIIRETEARSAAQCCGVPASQLHFLNLRFYRTGTAKKGPIQEQDRTDIAELMLKLQPALVFVAGELSDPHGTHRVCAEAIFTAFAQVRKSLPDTEVWLYRGAWEEWEPHEIEWAVPLGPALLEQKKLAIFRHQSQKDRAMFPGSSDQREFWQRAEDRNKATARLFDSLGLPEYYAMEAFVRWQSEADL